MILSHKHKFVMIEIPKTGTSSMHGYLEYRTKNKLHYDPESLFTNHISTPRTDYPDCWRHCKIKNVLDNFPEAKDYFKFCFVRNPWDRLISWYSYDTQINPKTGPDFPGTRMALKGFLRTRKEFGSDNWNQLDYMTYNGEFVMDFVGRYENLSDDWLKVLDSIGIPEEERKMNELPHALKTEHKHYSEHYDEHTEAVVREKCSQDIDFFNYKFDKV